MKRMALDWTFVKMTENGQTSKSDRSLAFECFCGVGYRWKHGHLDWMKMKNLGRYHQQRNER